MTVAYAQPLATVQIRYYMPQASEVFLVWGVNGWQTVPVLQRPPGTLLKENTLHTPMNREGDAFVIDLQTPAGTTINYGFLITKAYTGQAVNEWETALGEGYQAIAVDDLVIEARTKKKLKLVAQEFRYRMADASKVFLVWGINGWNVVPEEQRAEGTAIKNNVMHTPMSRETDMFVGHVQVFAGTTVNYGFLITKTRDNEPTHLWDGLESYQIVATEQDGVVEVETALLLTEGQLATGTVVSQEIRHRLPDAGEVFLVWGIDGWAVVPEELRPKDTEIKNQVMHTPMVREDDTFVAQVQVPAGATIDYGFLITKTNDDLPVRIWNGNEEYRIVARQGEGTGPGLIEEQPLASSTDTALVTQEIRYRRPEANEVFLVWRNDGEEISPEEIESLGTQKDDKVSITPMSSEGDTFSAKLQVPVGSAIDYLFLITKTTDNSNVEMWESADGQPYHTIAGTNAIVEIDGRIALPPQQSTTGTSIIGLCLLLIGTTALLVLGVVVVAQRLRPRQAH